MLAEEQAVELEVDEERSDVEVPGANEREGVVHGHRFGVQDPVFVEVEADARFEEVLVVGTTRGSDEAVVRALGDDDADIDASEGCDLEGLKERLVWDEVRRGHDDAALRLVEGGVHELAEGGGVVGRAGGDDLERDVARGLDRILQYLVGEVVPGGLFPIAGEDGLERADGGALDAEADVAPCAESLGAVVGVDNVLRAGEGERVVDDRELAVVAEVDTRDGPAEEADGEHGVARDAGVPEPRSEGLEHRTGADGVHEEAALDASFRGARERIADAHAGLVAREDVVEEVGGALGVVDRVHELVDEFVGVGDEGDRVADERRGAAQIPAEDDKVVLGGADGCWDRGRVLREELGGVGLGGDGSAEAAEGAAAEVDAAEQHVEDEPDPRQEIDYGEPGERRGGAASSHDDGGHEETDRPFAPEVQKAEPREHGADGTGAGCDGAGVDSMDPWH